MDSPKASFWGWLTKEGRLKNKWARGIEERDPEKSLEYLRQVQQNLKKNPAEFSHLWMSFLDTFLEVSRLSALTNSDMKAVEEMGDVISNFSNVQIHAEDVWLRVVKAYDLRKEERHARTLLGHIYNSSSVSGENKIRCVRELAKRSAKGDDQINIYLDHLQHVSDPAKETDIMKLLGSLCAVDFDSEMVLLRRAGEVAQRLLEFHIQVAGVYTALGLNALLIEHITSQAVRHFEIAFNKNPQDRLALVGLLSSLVQSGDYGKAVKIAEINVYPDDMIIKGLINLSTALQWLNDPEAAGLPPCSASSLWRSGIGKYAGESLEKAVGILYLLEGNARQAVEILLPLSEKYPEQHQLNYYAIWAALITGNKEAVASRYVALARWKWRWTIGCLMLDTDPIFAEEHKVQLHLGEVTSDYNSIIMARLALAQGELPEQIEWKYNPGAILAENLEALRTLLGYAIYRQDIQTLEQTISMPIFKHLPLADQMLWRGLYSIRTKDFVQGRKLLEEAAIKHEYHRASMVLSVHLLEHNMVKEAKQFLDRASAGRKDRKIELLNAYMDACEGKIDTAVGRLDKLAVRAENRVLYALGNLYLQCADESRKSNNIRQFEVFRKQAASAFGAAHKKGDALLPDDCKALMHCAEFFAYPERKSQSYVQLWQEVKRLETDRQRKWLVWNAYLSQLWWGTPSGIAEASKDAVTLIESVDSIEESAHVAVVSAIAHACTIADDINQAHKLAANLGILSNGSERQAIKHFYRIGISTVIRMHYLKAKGNNELSYQQIISLINADPGNLGLALLLAQIKLQDKKYEEAGDVLLNATPEDQFEKCLCTCLACVLKKQTVTIEALPHPSPQTSPKVIQACDLLRAAAAFTSGVKDEGYKAVIDAMNNETQEMLPIFNAVRFLPSLCLQSTINGHVPAFLINVIHDISKVKNEQLSYLAQCSAAIGELEYASNLWEKAITKNPDNSINQDYTEFLCYLAVAAYNSGDYLGAAQKLRAAAKLGGK